MRWTTSTRPSAPRGASQKALLHRSKRRASNGLSAPLDHLIQRLSQTMTYTGHRGTHHRNGACPPDPRSRDPPEPHALPLPQYPAAVRHGKLDPAVPAATPTGHSLTAPRDPCAQGSSRGTPSHRHSAEPSGPGPSGAQGSSRGAPSQRRRRRPCWDPACIPHLACSLRPPDTPNWPLSRPLSRPL
jgi:hypothetical protein